MNKLRFIGITSAILSISLWIFLGFYFVLTNHWAAFTIALFLIPLFVLTLIADALCVAVLVNGIKRQNFDRVIAIFVFLTSILIVCLISQ
jgi:FtsH-binding integral membrane protein